MRVSSMTYEIKGYMNISFKIIKLCPDQLGSSYFAIRSHSGSDVNIDFNDNDIN